MVIESRRKVIFYRPRVSLRRETLETYLFRPKEEILRRDFELVTTDSGATLLKLLEQNREAVLFYFINPEIDPRQYPLKVVKAIAEFSGIRVALHGTDPFSQMRSLVADVIQHTNPHAVFLNDAVTEAYQRFSAPTFYWPWSVNRDDYREIPEGKAGLFYSFSGEPYSGYYGWRVQNRQILEEVFGSCLNVQGISREAFLSTLAGSRFGATCGSCTNTIVSKHLEIPASGACLIAEDTVLLREMGFRNGVNCIAGTGGELKRDLEEVRDNEAKWEALARAGRKLVLEKHAHENRTGLKELTDALARGRAAASLMQTSPFAGLTDAPAEGRPAQLDWWNREMPPRDLAAIHSLEEALQAGTASREDVDRLKEELLRGHPDLRAVELQWLFSKGQRREALQLLYTPLTFAFRARGGVHLDAKLISILRENAGALPPALRCLARNTGFMGPVKSGWFHLLMLWALTFEIGIGLGGAGRAAVKFLRSHFRWLGGGR